MLRHFPKDEDLQVLDVSATATIRFDEFQQWDKKEIEAPLEITMCKRDC